MEPLAVAALVAVLVCLASVFAVEWTLSVAIVEIIAGVLAGNLFGIRGAPWLDFLAQFGGVLLTLSLLFVQFSWTTAVFFAASAVIIVLAPRVLPPVFERYGARVIEPEIKLLFAILFGFMLLASLGKSHAVLPVFVLGLVLGPMFHRHRELQRKLRIVAFGAITPFFFLKGGMNVSLHVLGPQLGLVLGFLAVKLVAK